MILEKKMHFHLLQLCSYFTLETIHLQYLFIFFYYKQITFSLNLNKFCIDLSRCDVGFYDLRAPDIMIWKCRPILWFIMATIENKFCLLILFNILNFLYIFSNFIGVEKNFPPQQTATECWFILIFEVNSCDNHSHYFHSCDTGIRNGRSSQMRQD